MRKYSHILALVVAGCAPAAQAKDLHTSFTVSATVRAVADIEVESAPAGISLTAEDIARGFVDVAQPTQIVVRSNSQEGFALDILTVTPMLSAMFIRGLESEQFLGSEGGTLVQRWQHAHSMDLSLKFRLQLAPGLTAGRYPWPLRLAVRPLESI